MKETMIQKNDDEKTTTQPKRERERKRFENACNNHPNNRDTYESHIREKSAQNSPHKFQNSVTIKEKKAPPKQSLSLSDGVPSDRPNNVSSSFYSSWFSSSSSDTNHRPKRFVFGKISVSRAVPVANRHDGKDPFRLA